MFSHHFPVLSNNPGLVYLDNAASTQKPAYVVEKTDYFLRHHYANIHRGIYDLAEESERIYEESKKKIASLLHCHYSEIVYGYNATHCSNLLAQSLVMSGVITQGSRVLLGVRDHHAAIVPWQILAKKFGFFVDFIHVKDDFSIDWDDFQKKYTDDVAVVSCGAVSNITGYVYDVAGIKQRLRDDTFFIVDAAQALPHFVPDVSTIAPDAMFFTAHKMLAYTGLGILYIQKERLKMLQPMMGGGGNIEEVTELGCTLSDGTDKFEAGTPNIVSAASFLYALEYVESIGGYETIQEYEEELIAYAFQKFDTLHKGITLIAAESAKNAGVFSFMIKGKNVIDVNEVFADANIAIRCGGHCAHPFLQFLGYDAVCRMSLNFSNTREDIDRFFVVLSDILDSQLSQ